MRPAARLLLIVASIGALLAVALGAFGAHMLRGAVSQPLYNAFQTGVQYHALHAVALLGIGLLVQLTGSRKATVAGWLLVIGILLFSGSLYAMTFSGLRGLGIITPFGGLTLMIGWAYLAWGIFRHPSESHP